MSRRSPRSAFAAARAAQAADRRRPLGSRALLVVDNRPLQQAAWQQLLAARKRLAKATADLHRHENVDEPAFLAWTATTFPTLLTELRELAAQFAEKDRLIASVEDEAFCTGRSPAEVWFRRKNPPADSAAESAASAPPPPRAATPWDDLFGPGQPDKGAAQEPFGSAEYEKLMEEFFAEHGIDPDDPAAAGFRENIGGCLGFGSPTRPSAAAADPAREIYRRLVQQLHPDRGGEWTPARARLWHEVQRAWAARDLDWLSRLEVEWETAAEVIGPASPVGRLLAALREIAHARRDAARRVRAYRSHPAWRFQALAARPAPAPPRWNCATRSSVCAIRCSKQRIRSPGGTNPTRPGARHAPAAKPPGVVAARRWTTPSRSDPSRITTPAVHAGPTRVRTRFRLACNFRRWPGFPRLP